MTEVHSSFSKRHWFDWVDRRTAQFMPEPPERHLDTARVVVWLIGAGFSVLAWTVAALMAALLLLHAFRPADALMIDRTMIAVPSALFDQSPTGAKDLTAEFQSTLVGQPVPLRAATAKDAAAAH